MTKKLKILYHHRVAAQDGQSVHIQELTKSFSALGHELIFVGPSLQPKEFGEQNRLLAMVRQALPSFAQELLELLYDLYAYRKLLAAYNEHQPDVLYERHNLFLSAGRKLKEKTGIPYFLEVNAPLTEERSAHSGLKLVSIARAIETRTWRSADRIFPVSDELANSLRGADVQEDAIKVLHNGINHQDYETVDPHKIRDDFGLKNKLVLGFTGFVREWHRLDNIISLIAEFSETDSPHLLIVGDGPAINDCKAQAIELKVENRVHFAGFIGRAQIPEYLAAMDIALQPAVTSYASPLKIFEYMRSGLAIVAPNQANIREILTDGEDALLFSPEDEYATSEKIRELVKNPTLRKKLGKAARSSIDTNCFTWRENAMSIMKIATAIIQERGKNT